MFHRVKFSRKGAELKALAERGIGYHHASLEAKEKQLVEVLFRKGFIRVGTFFHSKTGSCVYIKLNTQEKWVFFLI